MNGRPNLHVREKVNDISIGQGKKNCPWQADQGQIFKVDKSWNWWTFVLRVLKFTFSRTGLCLYHSYSACTHTHTHTCFSRTSISIHHTPNLIFTYCNACAIDHFTVVLTCLALEWKQGWSWSCFDRNLPIFVILISRNLHKKKRQVSIKTRSTSASLSFKGHNCKMIYCNMNSSSSVWVKFSSAQPKANHEAVDLQKPTWGFWYW